MKSYDCCIIGGGPGGYVAGIRAAQLGLKTVVIEKDKLGGICLNWGCIPTKALLRSSEILHLIQNANDYGIKISGKVSVDVTAVVARSRKISSKLNLGVISLLKKNKVDVVYGTASLTNKTGVIDIKTNSSSAESIQAKHIVIATGSKPIMLPQLQQFKDFIWNYRDAMIPKALPKRLLVIGAGAIGIEFASFYHTCGTEVTVVEMLPHILPVEDSEIANLLQKQLVKSGINILTKHIFVKAKSNKNEITVTLKGDKGQFECSFDKIIVSIGVQGNIEGLNLEKQNVKTEKSIILTDGFGRTNVKGIYAIGDVCGSPMLAHKAESQGEICVESIAGSNNVHELDKNMIPGCTYCYPQVASIGLTEAKAKELNIDVKVGRFPFLANGKAIALGEDQGLIKTIFSKKTGQLLGAHMIGAEVTELIQGFAIAMKLETTEEDLINTVFPHPTLSEMMRESVMSAYNRAIHI